MHENSLTCYVATQMKAILIYIEQYLHVQLLVMLNNHEWTLFSDFFFFFLGGGVHITNHLYPHPLSQRCCVMGMG